MIVMIFDDESSAFEGLKALKDLDRDGSITLYSQTVIEKDDKGEVTVKDEQDSGPMGTALGMATGSLVGILGGPAGLLLGGYSGAIAGMVYDMQNAGIDGDFVDDVSKAITNNKVAIVADVDEEWTAPIDATMKDFNAIVFRRLKYYPDRDQAGSEIEILAENLESLDDNLLDAPPSEKIAIIEQIKSQKEILVGMAEELAQKLIKTTQEYESKRAKIESQLKDAGEWNTKRLKRKLDRLESKYSKNKDGIEELLKQTKDALEITPLSRLADA